MTDIRIFNKFGQRRNSPCVCPRDRDKGLIRKKCPLSLSDSVPLRTKAREPAFVRMDRTLKPLSERRIDLITANLNNIRVYADYCTDRSLDYHCPECGERVLLAKGSIKIAHFKHQAHTACEYSGETMEHLRAKAWIYKALKQSPDIAEVEAECSRFEGIRPDVAFRRKNSSEWIGIEIQHSGISKSELSDRCLKYRANGVHILWIATEKLYKKIVESYYNDTYEVKLSNQSQIFMGLHNALLVFSGDSLMAFKFKNVVRVREEYSYYDGFTGNYTEETLKTVFRPVWVARIFEQSFIMTYPHHIIQIKPVYGWDDFAFFDEFYGGAA